MNIIGRWNVAKVAMFDENFTLKFVTAAELDAMTDRPEVEEYKQMFSAKVEFTADGKVLTIVPVPADQIEEAKAEGATLTDDGYVIMDQRDWKEENGRFFYNTGNSGTVMGEEIDPYVPLDVDADGNLPFSGGMMLLQKE